MWDNVPVDAQDDGWAELDENGWGALIGWAAGAHNLRRAPADDTGRTVEVSWIGPVGKVYLEEPFTALDRRIVDEEANSYLADAGIPPRPGGFIWLIWLPPQFSTWEEFRDIVTGSVYARAAHAAHPSEIAPVMREVVRNLYGSDVPQSHR